MTDYQTKHELVDDYPYICYSPDVDANTDELGGGGGGGDAVMLEVESGEGSFTIIGKTANDLFELASNGVGVHLHIDTGVFEGYLIMTSALIMEDKYYFNFEGNNFSFEADNPDDYPICQIG